MKISLLKIIPVLIVTAALCLAGGVAATDGHDYQAPDKQLYTCGMHPEIISDQPGICPICNMKLTPKKDGAAVPGSVTIDPTTRRNMGLVTASVEMRQLQKTVHTFGEVTIPEPNVQSVTLKTTGWVERLMVAEEGQEVFRGQPLAEIYAPELTTAQREYLVALTAADSSASLGDFLSLARRRLENLGLSDYQIEHLNITREVSRTIIIRSPLDGFILSKKVDVGDRIGPMSELYRIGNIDQVWVTAKVYEGDLPFITMDQAAIVTVPSLAHERFKSRIAFISPTIDKNRQLDIRLEFDNTRLRLKPGMYAEVEIISKLPGTRPAVPRSAVINSGIRRVVYVASDEDTFEARTVATGSVADGDLMEIKDGLTEGERVVVSGQFLLDSETRLSEAIGGHDHGSDHSDPMPSAVPAMIAMDQADHDHDEPASDDPYDIHTCPMPEHFHVLNYGPGTCPDCGMALVSVAETDNDEVYVCPMPQCGVAESEPGTCPKCNMFLKKYEPGAEYDQ